MLTDCVKSFFAREYPLIKLFNYGNEILMYDAKAHFVFVISTMEINVLMDFISQKPEEEIINLYSAQSSRECITQLLGKFKELTCCGLFIKGMLAQVSPVDREVIKEQLVYYDENILLRKFCLKVTENCNYRCAYCKSTIGTAEVSPVQNNLGEEDAYRGITYYFNKYIAFFNKLSAEKKELLLEIVPPTLAWYGGEPFLNFSLIKKSAEYFKSLPWANYSIKVSDLRFSSNTNLSIMNDEILNFLVDNRVSLFASLDGPEEEHDKCRVFANGEGTFKIAYHNLLKIKKNNDNYFKECVSIFGVYTDQHDYDKCTAFTRNIGALLCQHFPAEYTGVFVADLHAGLDYYNNAINNNLKDYKKNVLTESKKENIRMDKFSNLFSFAKLNYDHPSGKNSLNLLLTCPMGFDNVMVGTQGEFLICHKVNGEMPIGNCASGLDYEKLITLNAQYNSTINNHECTSCWAVNFCNICAASRMNQDHFVNPTKEECDFFRLGATYDFLCFIHLSLEYPDLLEKIFDYRNDQKKYIGIIDSNEF